MSLLHALHVALAILARAEIHFMHAPRHGFLGARREPKGVRVLAQQLSVADDGQIDVATGGQGETRELRRRLFLDRAALRMQVADDGVGRHDMIAQ